MVLHTLVLPLLWSAALLAALVLYPLLAGLGTPKPVAGLGVQTLAPIQGRVADPRLTARASSLGYATQATGPASPVRAVDPFTKDVAEGVFRLTNQERQRAGLPPLLQDPALALAARAHSLDMLERGFFDHVTPEGLTPSDRVAGIHRRLIGAVGENLYKDTQSPPAQPALGTERTALTERTVRSLMASPGHRDNILRREFTHLGVGAAYRNGEALVTQVFADAKAFLAADLPPSVKRHGTVVLDLQGLAPGTQPQQFALFQPDRGVRAFGPANLAKSTIDAAAGRYRLEIVFTTPDGRSALFGPDIDVTP